MKNGWPWIDRIRDAAVVAIDTETTSLDPMQAELVGISLATEPGRACYIPLAHKKGAGDLLGGGLIEGQVPRSRRSRCSSRCSRMPRSSRSPRT